MINSKLGPSGTLTAKLIKAPGPGLSWKVRNTLRWSFLWGYLVNLLAYWFSKITGIVTMTTELEARLVKADGSVINYGVVSRRVVTDAGVAFLVDDWDGGANDFSLFNYHASGTTNTAEAAGDTALAAEATTITDRVAGTKSQPAANQMRTIGTQSFTNTGTIVEHGLFSVVTESSGTLWDRSVFTGIAVANGDSIQWTYTCTINSGS